MVKKKITILFFENKKWYLLLAKLIQYVSKKIYTFSDIQINHVAIMHAKKVYEFKWRKGLVVSKFNKDYLLESKKYNNVYACDLYVDNFNYNYIKEVKNDQYSLLHAVAGYNAVVLFGRFFGLIFNKFFNSFRGKIDKQYCNKFVGTLYNKSCKKKHRDLNVLEYQRFAKTRVKDLQINLELSTFDDMIKESIPMDIYIFLKEYRKLNIYQL